MKRYRHPYWEEIVVTKADITQLMELDNVEEFTVELCKVDIGGPGFYCQAFGEVGDRDSGVCGKDCRSYKPRNGKNGICKYWRHTYEGTGKFETITKTSNEN